MAVKRQFIILTTVTMPDYKKKIHFIKANNIFYYISVYTSNKVSMIFRGM